MFNSVKNKNKINMPPQKVGVFFCLKLSQPAKEKSPSTIYRRETMWENSGRENGRELEF